ncbi:MAG: ABC transporter permease [Dehalococcoidia bacterium]
MKRLVFGSLSFFEQWGAEVIRQPALMFTLVVAPFLLLFAFGAGVELGGPRPNTLVVQSPDASVSIEPLLADLEQHVLIEGITESLPLARRSLERGDIDAVVVVPDNPQAFLEEGTQVPLQVLIGEVDPVRRSYARAYLRDQVAALNQRTIEQVLEEAQAGMGDVPQITADARGYVDVLDGARNELEDARTHVGELRAALVPLSATVADIDDTASQLTFFVPGLSRTQQQTERLRNAVTDLQSSVDEIDSRLATASGDDGLPTEEEIASIRGSLDEIDGMAGPLFGIAPQVISAPFRLELEDVTPVAPTFTSFYSPGVLALLVQHLAITLGALTLSRMRLLGVVNMLRVAPIRPVEVMLGNYLSYTVLTGIAAAALVALLIGVLGVPVFGAWWLVLATVVLLILCSLGIGFVVSLLSSSAQQATQVAMLILLGSIFFSGFAFSLDRITWPVRALSYLFPSTFGLRTLQDVMLRGLLRHPEDLVVLLVATVVLFVVGTLLMRRELRAR